MKTSYKLWYILLTAGLLSQYACTPTADAPAASKGEIDVSKYVSIGNSITSGYADNALYYDGQLVSYPNLIAQQFKLVGGGDFNQPYVPQNSVGIGSAGNAKLVLGVVNGSLSPVPAAESGDMGIFTTSVAAQGPFNNMGVPGAKATTTVYPGYGNPANGAGNYNPFFTRMTTSPATASILTDAVAQKPTFFSMFIGNNDVLAYALAGGASDAITPTDGPAGVGFNSSIDAIVATLMATATKGIVANIPDITSIPYFTTVPYNGLALTSQAEVDALNTGYATLIAAGLMQKFTVGANPFVIADATAPGGLRQIKSGELILLSALSQLSTGLGSSTPIPNSLVLTASEISSIQTATTAYNAKLKAVADAKGLAFVDVAAFMVKAKTGIEYNGRAISATFVTGGAFSLDGIHLTPLGNALLANEFIKSINSKYSASIPQVDATNYIGVKFP